VNGARGLCVLALLGLGAGTRGDELSGADKLRVVYSNQFSWTRDGLPVVTVRVMEHRPQVTLVSDGLRVVPDGDKPFQVITKVTVQPVSYKAKLAKAGGGSLPPNVRGYLGAADGFDPASPTLKKIAAEVKGKNSVETVKNILAWLHKNVTYKQETTSIVRQDFKTVDEIVERGHAE